MKKPGFLIKIFKGECFNVSNLEDYPNFFRNSKNQRRDRINRSQSHASTQLSDQILYKMNHDLNQEGCRIKKIKKIPQKLYKPLKQQSYTLQNNNDASRNYHLSAYNPQLDIKTKGHLKVLSQKLEPITKSHTNTFKPNLRSQSSISIQRSTNSSRSKILEQRSDQKELGKCTAQSKFLKKFDRSMNKYYRRMKLTKGENSAEWQSPFITYKTGQKRLKSETRNISVFQKRIKDRIKESNQKLFNLSSIESPNPKFFNKKIEQASSGIYMNRVLEYVRSQGSR
ncbi:unnamed protein product [Moneuplotes crassus]|uniref:Uncharacterized protein n=1 Tax=Euplotes crassus TaxID=5936 RepID=A0AAD1UCF9_EUPCR|nr:unnamed protein product [Moneuplotes crassus]